MKKKFLSFFFLSAFSFLFSGLIVYAQDYGLGATAGAAGLQRESVPTLVGNVVGTALSMIGVLFFVLMVYGGLLWMTSRGNEEQTRKAKDTIVAATIGIIVVLSAYAITTFVFSTIQGGPSCRLRSPVPASTPVCTESECIGVESESACNVRTCCIWQ